MTNDNLPRTQWITGVIGFLCAAAVTLQIFFFCSAFYFFATPIRFYMRGRPLTAFTFWVTSLSEHLPNNAFLWFGVLLFSYLPLPLVVYRARSVASVALGFALWFGLLLACDLLVVSFVAVAWAIPMGRNPIPLLP